MSIFFDFGPRGHFGVLCRLCFVLSPTMSLFLQFTIILGVALLMAMLMRLLRQPLLIGHILTGIIIGPTLLDLIQAPDTFELFSQFGVALLLFTVGLNLNPKVIREYGKVSVFVGVGQVLFTSIIGYALAILFGITPISALYVAVALAFSSTIIILKLLQDKGDMESLYGKIAVGLLIVQDLIAVLLLFAVPLVGGAGDMRAFALAIATGLFALVAVFAVGHFLVPRLHSFLSRSQELLFLFAIVWGVGIAAAFHQLGFSLESGALVAGVALANLPSRREIHSRLVPVRDFFIVLFFISLGAHMTFANPQMLGIALALSLFVLIGNPLILMIIMGALGYTRRTGFETGLTVAQISEFSLVLVALGVSLGHVERELLSLVTAVALITIFGSTYFILYSRKFYNLLAPLLSIFERHRTTEREIETVPPPSMLLFGCRRSGHDFITLMKESGEPYLVVDYDPDIVTTLCAQGVVADYGDAGEVEYLQDLDLSRVRVVVSTIPDRETNELLYDVIKEVRPNALMIGTAEQVEDALDLYELGYDHVVVPHFSGGALASRLLRELGDNLEAYVERKVEHVQYLQYRATNGG